MTGIALSHVWSFGVEMPRTAAENALAGLKAGQVN